MILKKSTTVLPKNFLFSAAAVIVIGASIAYPVRMLVFPPPTPSCGERYGTPTVFGLEGNGGKLLTSDELQARLAGRDWGLSENVEIVRFGDGSAGAGFKVQLPAKALPPRSGKGATSGMGFTWLPSRFAGATAACLGYHVYLPEDFDFSIAGVLPGLTGVATEAQPDASAAAKPAGARTPPAKLLPLETKLQWQPGGAPGLAMRSDFYQYGGAVAIGHTGYRLPTGRWFRVEQEMVLNDIGKKNGAVRVWIDGELKLEVLGEKNRLSEKVVFTGVSADTHYADAALAWKPARTATQISLTTFELWWQ